MTRILALYSRDDFNRRYQFTSIEKVDFVYSYSLLTLFKQYNIFIIPNTPTYFNLVVLLTLLELRYEPFIFVDSILEPLHIAYWKRWRDLNITGAYQLNYNYCFHPLRSREYRLPIKSLLTPNLIMSHHNKVDSPVLGITVPNNVSHDEKQRDQVRDYIKEIILHCERTDINYKIRDRNDFFGSTKFFKTRISYESKSESLVQFFSTITHLVTPPGSLVLEAALSNIYTCQIIYSYLFCNTPSAYIVTIPSPVENWFGPFLTEKNINHKFQFDYYSSLRQDFPNTNLYSLVDSDKINNSSNTPKISIFNIILSYLHWNLRLCLKSVYKKLKDKA